MATASTMTTRPLYGQVVVGPPGSGKTTYCNGMQQYLKLLGRNAWVINLDPANEAPPSGAVQEGEKQDSNNAALPYDTLLDVCQDVVNVSSVMRQLELGPNGGLVYCMEYLEVHAEEIVAMIQERITTTVVSEEDASSSSPYLLFDLPGQVELHTHGTCVQHLLQTLSQQLDLRLCLVQLLDASQVCVEATKFISATLLGTTTMLRLELPTVNVLSKIDLLANNYGDELPFSLEYFTECHDLHRLLPYLDDVAPAAAPNNDTDDNVVAYTEDEDYQKARAKTRHSTFFRKHTRLHEALAEVVEDFGLLSFLPLNINDAESVGRVLARIDKCNGYVFLNETDVSNNNNNNPSSQRRRRQEDLFQCAIRYEDSSSMYESIAPIQERLNFAQQQGFIEKVEPTLSKRSS